MRLIKMFGLAAIAAVAAMAFIGASSASATGSTQLCNNTSSPCNSPYTSIHMELTAGTVGKLHGTSPNIDILCLEVLAAGDALGLGNPQQIHLTTLEFEGCGTSADHDECTITSLEDVLANVLRESASLGSVEGVNGKTFTECIVFGFLKIKCEYNGAGLSFDVKPAGGSDGHGMLNAEGTPLPLTSGGSLCPDTSEISEGLLEPLTDVFLGT